MKRILFILVICFSLSQVQALENSIIPLVEKYEQVENLPQKKYTSSQYQKIVGALEKKQDRIRLVSYNVLFNIYDQNYEEAYRWPKRLPRVVEVLNEMQPDIIGVQELMKSQYDDLMPALKNDFDFVYEPNGEKEINGIFYRKSRFELVKSKVWNMAIAPGDDGKQLTAVILKDRQTDKKVAIFNAHFAYTKIENREFQARFVAKKIKALPPDLPALFMGDLNTFSNRLDLEGLPFHDGDYIHRLLTRGNLRSAATSSLLGHLGPISTFTNTEKSTAPFQGVGVPGIVLDHIYATRGITLLIHAIQPATVENLYPSDHLPVLVDFLVD